MTNLASTHDLEKMIIKILLVVTNADLVQGFLKVVGLREYSY